MIPNYITAEERLAYESGEKKLNDETWIKIYTDFAKLVPYLPEAFASIDNDNANVMFGLGQSAMLIDGSWSYGTLAGDDYDIDVGFFPIPAPAGNAAGFSLHPDFGIAGNAASAHPEEVKAFLTWLASVEGAKITAKVIPEGFLPMINADVAPEGSIIAEMNAVGEGKNADMRFVWEHDGSVHPHGGTAERDLPRRADPRRRRQRDQRPVGSRTGEIIFPEALRAGCEACPQAFQGGKTIKPGGVYWMRYT